jgi:hypothetical protein
MSFTSIILFIIYTFGLGYTATFFIKNSENFLERNLMRMGMGLGAIITLGLLLNLLSIPLDWRIFLFLSLALPIYHLLRNIKTFQVETLKLKITKSNLAIFIMLLIFLATLYMYEKGAFAYPYLEDDDSWSHAMAVKYVSIEKTVFQQGSVGFHYMDPYPPAYDMLFGILHQTNNSVYWTLKFFNALIISLSIIFFYFFVKEFIGNKNKALFATFALAAVPAFLSHFIWALALTVPLYFVSFYCTERIKHDKKWFIPAAIVIAATLTSSPTHSTYFGLFFVLYYLAKVILEKKVLLYHALAGFLGLSLSFIVWWVPMFFKYGFRGTLLGLGLRPDSSLIAVGGTADRVYTMSDFIWTKTTNMINNPVGIGVFLSILTVIALIFILLRLKDLFKKENHWLGITLAWFILTFYAVNAVNMPIKISPFRAWMLLVIPVSILAAEGTFFLMNSLKKFGIGKAIVLSLIIIGVLSTSAYQKYTVNTAQWPPGAFWTSNEEIVGYLWIKDNLPLDTKVFTFVNDAPIIAYDKFTCHWCEDIHDFQKTGFNESAEKTYNWLKSKNYDYIVVDGQTSRKFGANETNNKVQSFINSNQFRPVFNNNGVIIFELFKVI